MQTKKCSLRCNNGVVFNPVTRREEICPECAQKRTEELSDDKSYDVGGELSELLGYRGKRRDTVLNLEKVVSPTLMSNGELDPTSVSEFKDRIKELHGNLLIRKYPENSYCFGTDRTCPADKIAIPLLAAAYKGGMTVAPFTSDMAYTALVRRERFSTSYEHSNDNLREPYINSDIVVMLLNSSRSEVDMLEAKGLMQCRAAMGKPTIFVTSRPREYMYEITTPSMDEASYYTAFGSFVKVAKRPMPFSRDDFETQKQFDDVMAAFNASIQSNVEDNNYTAHGSLKSRATYESRITSMDKLSSL